MRTCGEESYISGQRSEEHDLAPRRHISSSTTCERAGSGLQRSDEESARELADTQQRVRCVVQSPRRRFRARHANNAARPSASEWGEKWLCDVRGGAVRVRRFG